MIRPDLKEALEMLREYGILDRVTRIDADGGITLEPAQPTPRTVTVEMPGAREREPEAPRPMSREDEIAEMEATLYNASLGGVPEVS